MLLFPADTCCETIWKEWHSHYYHCLCLIKIIIKKMYSIQVGCWISKELLKMNRISLFFAYSLILHDFKNVGNMSKQQQNSVFVCPYNLIDINIFFRPFFILSVSLEFYFCFVAMNLECRTYHCLDSLASLLAFLSRLSFLCRCRRLFYGSDQYYLI